MSKSGEAELPGSASSTPSPLDPALTGWMPSAGDRDGGGDKDGREFTDRAFLDHLADRLDVLPTVRAVALGGSRAQGTHGPDSDWDLAVYYRGSFDPADLRAVGWEGEVSEIGGWGGGVFNGGAWLTVDGRRVDVHYRDLDVVERELANAEEGRFHVEPSSSTSPVSPATSSSPNWPSTASCAATCPARPRTRRTSAGPPPNAGTVPPTRPLPTPRPTTHRRAASPRSPVPSPRPRPRPRTACWRRAGSG